LPAKNSYCPKCKSTNIKENEDKTKPQRYRDYRGLICLEPRCGFRWTDERVRNKNDYSYRNF